MTSTTEEFVNNNNSKCTDNSQPQRKLIKADLDLLYGKKNNERKDSSSSSDSDYDYEETEPSKQVSGFYGHICPEKSQSTPVSPKKELRDFPNPKPKPLTHRRHSITTPTTHDTHTTTLITFPFEYTNTTKYPNPSPIFQRRQAPLPRSMSKSALQDEFLQSDHWQTAMNCLSLNLDEVVHIRNVLTKAELESLPLECSLKEDVQRGKVCFLCLKTRFGLIFGPYGNNCKLCKRTVCSKCCSKMRIPMNSQFTQIPVSTLSPSISPRDEERDLPGYNSTKSLTPTSILHLHNNASIPGSPNLSRRSNGEDEEKPSSRSLSPGIMMHGDDEDSESIDTFDNNYSLNAGSGPRSLPTVQSISLGLMAFKRKTFPKPLSPFPDPLHTLMTVCHDCRAMVLQIIKSSRAKKSAASGSANKNQS